MVPAIEDSIFKNNINRTLGRKFCLPTLKIDLLRQPEGVGMRLDSAGKIDLV